MKHLNSRFFFMPKMYEIYDRYAENYDELVSREDYLNNLHTFLNSIITGASVLELGAGTGRVTQMYIDKVQQAICCDRASHMLERAKHNLKDYSYKITFECIDTRQINPLKVKVDCVVEGWALGHTALDEFHRIDAFVSDLFQDLSKLLNDNGKMIFIETLGTNTEHPLIPDERLKTFYNLLEERYHMKKYVIRTDYRFKSLAEAKRILSFFFGEQMKDEVKDRYVKEYTGVWVLEMFN
jgi:ubiquinone/menaquinone biosynthesis C-methylase UbiE